MQTSLTSNEIIYEDTINLLMMALQSKTDEVKSLKENISELEKLVANCNSKIDMFNKIFDLRYPEALGEKL